jgi:hypothetical protein
MQFSSLDSIAGVNGCAAISNARWNAGGSDDSWTGFAYASLRTAATWLGDADTADAT